MAAKPDPEAEYGGYDYQYALEVPERFICNICTKVQRDPHLTSCCGQHFCESCLEHWFKKQGKKSCPHCRKGLHHFLNKERKRDIHELKIHCIHHGEGCQWVGELGNIQTHLDKLCSCVEVECTNKCRVSLGFTTCRKLKRKDLPHHLSNECYLRDYKCEHCGHVDTYEKIAGFTVIHMQRRKSHYDECPEYPLDCPNMCGTVAIKRKYMYAHQETVCPLETIACPNKCNTDLKSQNVTKLKRKDLREHLDSDCPLRRYKCEYCQYESTYTAITGRYYCKHNGCHYDECPEYPLDCPNICGAKQIKRKEMHTHQKTVCPLETIACPNKCNTDLKSQEITKLKQKDLREHLDSDCPLRKYKCEHCQYESTYTAIMCTGSCYGMYFHCECHYDECPEYPLKCPNWCGEKQIKRKDMSAHRDKCPLEPVECPFKEAGCETKLIRRDLDDHMKTQTQQHMLLTLQKCEGLRKRCDTLEAESNTLRKAVSMNVDYLLTTCTDKQRPSLQRLQAALTTDSKKDQSPRADSKGCHLKICGHLFTIEIPDLSQYKSGEVWHSPPFYFREGYKMCLALHPNGIGKGEGTHVSLSLLLMRGEFDDQLEWPIQSSGYHLKITLQSQNKPKPKSQGGQDPLLLSTETTTTAINVCSRCIPPTSDRLKRLPSYKYT